MPSPFAGRQMLTVLRDTHGDAIAVSETSIQDAQRRLARLEGMWPAPEEAALIAALISLKEQRTVSADDRIALVLTGTGFKCDPPPLPPPTDLSGSDDAIVDQVKQALAG